MTDIEDESLEQKTLSSKLKAIAKVHAKPIAKAKAKAKATAAADEKMWGGITDAAGAASSAYGNFKGGV